MSSRKHFFTESLFVVVRLNCLLCDVKKKLGNVFSFHPLTLNSNEAHDHDGLHLLTYCLPSRTQEGVEYKMFLTRHLTNPIIVVNDRQGCQHRP